MDRQPSDFVTSFLLFEQWKHNNKRAHYNLGLSLSVMRRFTCLSWGLAVPK
jgi:hypothetical protein